MDIHSIDFTWLKKQARTSDPAHGEQIRLALLADSATQLIAEAIVGYGTVSDIRYIVYEPEYDSTDREVFDPTSGLYRFQPDFVIIIRSTENLTQQFYRTPVEKRPAFAEEQLAYLETICNRLTQTLTARIILCNYPESNDGVFGNFANKTESSFLYQLRKLNFRLMEKAANRGNLFICDLAALLSSKGYEAGFDPKMYFHAHQAFSLSFLPWLAKHLHDIIMAAHGRFKKCLILDLDNTLWGGAIGDDGLEGIQLGELGLGKIFSGLQLWIRELAARGIVIAVCSKNDAEKARSPFLHHPQMELHLEDVAVFVANWESKVDNIRYIAQVLQIGFDTMVFLDDEPVERARVRQAIPGITVPELPEDPAQCLPYLRDLNLFETASYTAEDKKRTALYRQEATRTMHQQTFTGEADFLASLDMRSSAKAFDSFLIPRIAQLSQRSNQFNLRTIRYTEQEVSTLAANPAYLTLSFTLEDNYGDYGLIAFVVLRPQTLPAPEHPASPGAKPGVDTKTLFIENWVMSCRVLKRGMEQFTLERIREKALQAGYTTIIGEYLPTQKNSLVRDHYAGLGFTDIGHGRWELDLRQQPLATSIFIKAK